MADLTLALKGDSTDLLRKLDMVAKGLEDVGKKLDKMADQSVKATQKAASGFERFSASVKRSMVGMSNAIERNVKRAAVVLGAGMVATMVKGVKVAARYEKSLAKVSTLLGKSAAVEIPQYKKSIIGLSKATGESVDVLADSLFTIISATVKGSDTIAGANKLLAATAKLAVGGATDTAIATTALTTVLNSYNLGAEEAAATSDKLTRIAALANTTFGEMAPELGKIASVTAAAGISVEELGFMFATLTAGGRKVNMAMTDMRAIINGLTKPSEALKKIYADVGITSGAAAVKQMGVVKVLELIKEKTGGTFENIQKVIEQQEAWAGSAILLGERLDGAGEVIDQIGNSAGATEDAFKKMSDTFAFKSQQFKAKVNAVLIRIGDDILPVLIEKLDELSVWVDANSDEIVGFFKEAFDWFFKFGTFVMQHGATIATGLAAIWATGKIIEYWGILKLVVGGLGKAAKLVGVAGLAKGAAGAVVAAPAIGGAGALLMAQKAQEEGRELAKKYGEDWGEIAESVGTVISDLTEEQLDMIRQGSVGFGQLEKHAKTVFKTLREGAAPTFAQESKMRTVIKRMVEVQKDIRARADSEIAEKEFAAVEELGEKKVEEGKKTNEILSADQKKALAKLHKEREAAIRSLRQFEIQALDDAGKVRAKAEADIAGLREARFGDSKDRARAIFLVRQQMEKDLEEITDRKFDKIVKVEEKLAKARMEEEEIRRKEVLKFIEEKAEEEEKKRNKKEKEEEKKRKKKEDQDKEAASNLRQWLTDPMGKLFSEIGKKIVDSVIETTPQIAEVLGEAVGGIIQSGLDTGISAIKSVYGFLYEKAYSQIKELFSKAIDAAAEGDRLLVLTSEERARLEQERGGRELTPEESRGLATSMTPAELDAAQREGRLGEHEIVGMDTPEDRLQAVLEQMQSWWTNLANNLGPILTWVTEVAVPRLINAIIKSLPKIVQAINKSWKEALPGIVDLIAENLGTVLEQIPSIIEALIQGIMNFIKRLMERLPDILSAIFRFLTDSFTSLVGTIISLAIEGIPAIAAELTKALPEIVGALLKELFVRLIPEMAKSIGKAIKGAATGGPFGDTGAGKAGNIGLMVLSGGISALFHEGGMVADALRAHSGMFVAPSLGPGEVPIIAQVGESVLTREATQDAGGRTGIDEMNAGRGQRTKPVVNNFLSIEHLMSKDTRTVVDEMMGENIDEGTGRVAEAIHGSEVSGFEPRV